MRELRVGVRWWLSIAFALVAAAAAAAAVLVFSSRANADFRSHAEALVAGRSFVAAQQVMTLVGGGRPPTVALRQVSRSQKLALFLYGASPRPLAQTEAAAHLDRNAVAMARAGRRYVVSSDNGRHVVVGIPLGKPYTALVARSSDIALPTELRIVQDATVQVGAIAAAIGFVVGLLLAQLIALRLRRLSVAADAISSGDFGTPVVDVRIRDEFGALASALERMRLELRSSFGQLAFERDRLRLLLERLREGVVTVDAGLHVEFANAEAQRVLGPQLVEGAPLPNVDGLALRTRARRLLDVDTAGSERVTLPDGRTIAVVGVPAGDGADSAMLVLADLTDELRREAAEREFIANAAHELRTPLTTIVGAVEMLEAGAKTDPELRDRFIAHIGRESSRLAKLARTLLVLARAQTGAELPSRDTVDLCALLARVRAGLAPKAGVEVTIDCEPGLAVVTNGDLLEQAVRNLAENAVAYTDRGRVVLTAVEVEEGVRVGVADTGHGIDASTRPHVFDRFYRGASRRSDGYGLGLSLVQQVVRVLGARVELESEPGAGSRFTIVLATARVRELAEAAS